MSSDVTLPGTGAIIETMEQADGSQRQVIAVAEPPVSTELIQQIIAALATAIDPVTGRVRALIDPIGGAQTLGTITTVGTVTTVTTVATVTNQAQIGGQLASSVVQDSMANAWSNLVRPRIT